MARPFVACGVGPSLLGIKNQAWDVPALSFWFWNCEFSDLSLLPMAKAGLGARSRLGPTTVPFLPSKGSVNRAGPCGATSWMVGVCVNGEQKHLDVSASSSNQDPTGWVILLHSKRWIQATWSSCASNASWSCDRPRLLLFLRLSFLTCRKGVPYLHT